MNSVSYRADKGDTIKVCGLYNFDNKQKVSAVVELTRKLSKKNNTLTVGGLYTVDAQATVKGKAQWHWKSCSSSSASGETKVASDDLRWIRHEGLG